MSDLITSLVARTFDTAPVVQPRIASLYAATPPVNGSELDAPLDAGSTTVVSGRSPAPLVGSDAALPITRPPRSVPIAASAELNPVSPAPEPPQPTPMVPSPVVDGRLADDLPIEAQILTDAPGDRFAPPTPPTIQPSPLTSLIDRVENPGAIAPSPQSPPTLIPTEIPEAVTTPIVSPIISPQNRRIEAERSPLISVSPVVRTKPSTASVTPQIVPLVESRSTPSLGVPESVVSELPTVAPRVETRMQPMEGSRVGGQSDRLEAPPTPVIRISIGRIDVRAVTAPPAAKPRSQPAKPQVSLDDYLKSRNGGNG